jgi:hypothetical protein
MLTKTQALAFGAVALLASVALARAEAASPVQPQTASAAARCEVERLSQTLPVTGQALLLSPLPSKSAGEAQGSEAAGQAPAAKRCELREESGTTALFLGALGALGAWQVGRGKLQFSNMPAWYHTGGPVQIGHVTRFEPGAPVLIACDFDEPCGAKPPCFHLAWLSLLRCESLFSPGIAAPRAPPLASLA